MEASVHYLRGGRLVLASPYFCDATDVSFWCLGKKCVWRGGGREDKEKSLPEERKSREGVGPCQSAGIAGPIVAVTKAAAVWRAPA